MIANWAARYAELNFALVPTPPGQKGPRHAGWNLPENAIRDPLAARRFWTQHSDHGIGVLLEYSGLVSFDVDAVDPTHQILRAEGIDLDQLAASAPRIVGNPARLRLMYAAPAGIDLRHRTLAWPRGDDPRKTFAVFELRAGPISDALPPTIHVDTGKPYIWATPPRNGFPPLPDELLALWQDWTVFEKRARAACPWAPAPPSSPPRQPSRPIAPEISVIARFNGAHEVAAILENHGYVRRGKRFASPETKHAAGVVMLESGKVFCHHAGDPLNSDRALDAFDCFARLAHGGDVRAAVREAAKALGMNQGRRA